MAINFPNNPATSQEFTSGSNTWIWSGISWNIKPLGSTLDDLSDVNASAATAGQLLAYDGAVWNAITLSGTFNGGTISGALSVNNNTSASSASTGALTVAGGVGIGGALYVSTSIEVLNGALMVRNNNRLRLYDTDNSNFVGLRSPANLTADVTYVLPGFDGTSGQVLQTNGLGTLSWTTVTGGGGGGTSNPPGGPTSSVQFNNNGSFGGSTTFTYDSALDVVSMSVVNINDKIDGQDLATMIGLASITLSEGASITEFSTDNTLASGSNTKVPTELAVKTYVGTEILSKADINSPTFTGAVIASGSVTVTQNITANNNIVINKAPTATNHATNKQYVDVRSVAMSIALS